MNQLLEIRDLKKYFPGVKAVDGISFSIDHGTCFGLLGPNGAGKTTCIEVIEGIRKQDSGTILYKGAKRDKNFYNETGIQFQNTELPQLLTVIETLKTFRNLYNRRADIDYLIETCRLEDILTQDNRKISGGQKQRLLLAMALSNDPDLIFLDEPTTGLDPQSRRHLWKIIDQIKLTKTIVLTTHYMEEAEILCDKISIIDYGRIRIMGGPGELLKNEGMYTSISLKVDLEDSILDSFPCSWSRRKDKILIQTKSPNECINGLMKMGIDLSTMNVRRPNLEDLFLKLTGHELRS